MASSSTNVDLSGPTYCLITGASQGIGRAIAVEISKHLGPNSILLLLARNERELSATASLCENKNVSPVYKSIDLGVATCNEMKSVINESLVGRKIDDFALSVIFHNVGSLGNLTVEAGGIEDVPNLRQYYDLNVFNVITLNTQFLKLFKAIEDRIIVVNITSLCAIKPMNGMSYYCSGKAAREMYFRVLAEEKSHIRVLNYSPGPVETAMVDCIIEQSNDENLKEVFTGFKKQSTLLKPEITAKKCIYVLKNGKFTPGEHVDFFDVKSTIED